MAVPPLLEQSIPVPASESISKICYDLGCYYFPKELYGDAWRVFQKAFQCSTKEMEECEWYKTMIGYYEACCLMLNKPRPPTIKRDDLPYRFEEAHREYNFKEICQILQDDNIEQQIAFTQRLRLEDDLYREDRKEDLFNICGLNFVRNTLEE